MSYTSEQIARVVHEANAALQIVQGDFTIGVSPPWDELDKETKASSIEGVELVQAGSTPEQSHQNWLDFKRRHGWVYGPVKDMAKKTHPCMVPYDQLPEAQQVKDHLFGAIVRALS